MHRNRIIRTAAIYLLLLLAGCGTSSRTTAPESTQQTEEAVLEEITEVRSLSMATGADWSSSFKGKILEKELEKLEERTEGTVKIRLYDRNRLGNDAHLIAGVQAGTIDLMQSSPATQVNVVPEAAFFDIPGLFDSLEEWNALLSGEYLPIMQGCYEEAGLVLLDVFAFSWRVLSSSRPVAEADDLTDLRIRTMSNKYHEAFWKALGAEPVPYDFAELYFCISEGIAEAQENLLDILLLENLNELQSDITFTHHLPMISAIAMRKELYDSLSDAEREALAAFTGGLKEQLMARMPEEEERLAETLDHDYGLELHEPSPGLQAAMEKGREAVIALLREDLGEEKTEEFLAAAARVRS